MFIARYNEMVIKNLLQQRILGKVLRTNTNLSDTLPGRTVKVPIELVDVENARPIYGAIAVDKNKIHIAETNRTHMYVYEKTIKTGSVQDNIISVLRSSSNIHNGKYIAVGLAGDSSLKKLISKLWLEEDIVAFVTDDVRYQKGENLEDLANNVAAFFSKDNIASAQVLPSNEVEASELVTLDDYKKTAVKEDFDILAKLAREFKGKKLIFLSATPQGGGVALMRHALIRFYELMGIDAHWYILQPDPEAFIITKTKFHNVLQAVQQEGVELTEDDMKLYNSWTEQNAYNSEEVFKNSDVIIIDDPQPAGLIPYIKRVNPKVKLIYRSHIQIVGDLASTEGTPQRKTWSFIWNNVKDVDCFVAHPMKEFVPSDVPEDKVVYVPATTDPLDGLNKELSEEQLLYYLKIFNKLLIKQEKQTPLDLSRPYIIQIARFDPSKGIPDVIESYRILREMLEKAGEEVPQLIIAGNAAIDDPEGIPIYNTTVELLQTSKYKHLADDVKVSRLPHIDQLLDTLMRKAKIGLQLSIKEGFEIKVTEGLMKGIPMVCYRTGGIPWQVKENVNGFLVEPGNKKQVAKHMFDLLTDEKLYKKMSTAAAKYANKDYLTVPNALCWMYLAVRLDKGESIGGHFAWVKDLAYKWYKVKKK